MTIKEFKILSQKELSSFSSANLDSSVFIEHFLHIDKTQQLLFPNKILTEQEEEILKNALLKRKTGLPVAYIIENKEFYGYNFYVNKNVLIPKPDTEILVENAIKIILEKIKANPERIITICDMCTGSGCIGLSVFKELVKNKIPYDFLPVFVLADISQDALDVAKKNTTNLLSQEEQERIRFVRTNLFEQIHSAFDVILTNPPYVPQSVTTELLKDGRSEPRLALDGDINEDGSKSNTDDGLSVIKRLLPQAYEHLCHTGTILMETGEYNATKAEDFAKKTGFKNTKILKDLEGQLRVTVAHKI